MSNNGILMEIFAFLGDLVNIDHLSELLDPVFSFSQEIRGIAEIAGVSSVIIGLVLCFFGYRLIRIFCAAIGFFTGVSLGSVVAAFLIGFGVAHSQIVLIVCVAVFGILGAFTAFRAYLVGVFLYAFLTTFLVGVILFSAITDSLAIGLGAGVFIGIVTGIITVIYKRFWIILVTSVAGGMSAGSGITVLLQDAATPMIGLLLPIVLAIGGFIVQYIMSRKVLSEVQSAPPLPQSHSSPPSPEPTEIHPPQQAASSAQTPVDALALVDAPADAPVQAFSAASNCKICETAFDGTSTFCSTCGYLTKHNV